MRTHTTFTTIRSEGSILPADLLQRIASSDGALDGLSPDAYHLVGEKLNEAMNRAWNQVLAVWTSFQNTLAKLPPDDPATSVTREKWLLPLFQVLGYGRLLGASAIQVDDRSYPISHGWQHTPIHLVGYHVDLDRRTAGVAGAARSSPHSLLQEVLNRSPKHLWGFVANGQRLRILRDNRALTRQPYVEFDLEAMLAGEIYSDFVLLWLLCHQSRVEADQPEACWLERWSRLADQEGMRARDRLRDGVQQAIEALGRGFLAHPDNRALRRQLEQGVLSRQDYYRQLLRLVYRLIFLFVAEDRGLLLDPAADPVAQTRYTRFYSLNRLRVLAEKRRGTQHADLFQGLRLVLYHLGTPDGCPGLGLPALGGLFMPVISGQWTVISGRWAVGGGWWAGSSESVDSGQWTVVGDRWSVVGGRWSVGREQGAGSREQWAVGREQWAVDGGQGAGSREQWAVGGGQGAVSGGRWAGSSERWAATDA